MAAIIRLAAGKTGRYDRNYYKIDEDAREFGMHLYIHYYLQYYGLEDDMNMESVASMID